MGEGEKFQDPQHPSIIVREKRQNWRGKKRGSWEGREREEREKEKGCQT